MAHYLLHPPRHHHTLWPVGILISCLFSPISAVAAYNNAYVMSDEYREDVNNHGQIYVFGSLTESPCQISMDSINQSIDMGNIETADFNKVGSSGKPVPFHIELIDCINTPTALLDDRTNSTTWSTDQTGIRARFIAPTVPFYPELVKLNGIEGIGLQLSDSSEKALPLGEYSTPQLIGPGQGTLNYFLTPVRIAEKLQPGTYRALISFELSYD